jgi:hypothetical protein
MPGLETKSRLNFAVCLKGICCFHVFVSINMSLDSVRHNSSTLAWLDPNLEDQLLTSIENCRSISSANLYSTFPTYRKKNTKFNTKQPRMHQQLRKSINSVLYKCFRALHCRSPLICGNLLIHFNSNKTSSANEFSTGFLDSATWYLDGILYNLNVLEI